MAGSNILLFDQSKTNMFTDEEYAMSEQRTDGVQQGIASSKLQNKFQYQMSLIAYSIGQMMMENGYDANDADEVETFVGNLSDTIVQKIKDRASIEDAEGGIEDTKYMTAKAVKAAIDKFAPGGGGGGGATAAWDGEILVLTNSVPPNEES